MARTPFKIRNPFRNVQTGEKRAIGSSRAKPPTDQLTAKERLKYPGAPTEEFVNKSETWEELSDEANKYATTESEGGYVADPILTQQEKTENFKDAAPDRNWNENMDAAYNMVTPDMSREELTHVMHMYNRNKGKYKGDPYNFRLTMRDLRKHQKTLQ